MIILGGTHYVSTLLDSKKGSLTNRYQCANEHLKNDAKYFYAGALSVAAGAYAVVKKPDLVNKIAKPIGQVIETAVKKLPKFGFKDVKLKSPIVTGKMAMLIGAGISLATLVAKYANNKGRINQKYEDAAKIESQTKNVVLDSIEKEKAASKTGKKNYAEMSAV